MSAPRLNPPSKTIKEPSRKAKARVADAQAFGTRKLDPILDDCLEFLLMERPITVLQRMYDYLLSVKEGKPLEPEEMGAKTAEEVLAEVRPTIEKLISKSIVNYDTAKKKNEAEEAMLGKLVDHMKVLLDESVAGVE